MKTHTPYMPLVGHFPVAEILHDVAAKCALYRAALERWWRSLPPVAHTLHWPTVAMSVVALALLVSFYLVVSSSVQESQRRHKIAAMYDKATLLCKKEADQVTRANCLSQIKLPTEMAASPASWETPGAATVVAGLSDSGR